MWQGRSLCFWCVSCPGWRACRLWVGGSSWWSWWWSRLSWSRCWTPRMQTASTGSCSARARPYHSFLWVKPQQRSAIILEYFSNNIQLLYFCHSLTKACMLEWFVHKIKCQSLIQTRIFLLLVFSWMFSILKFLSCLPWTCCTCTSA